MDILFDAADVQGWWVLDRLMPALLSDLGEHEHAAGLRHALRTATGPAVAQTIGMIGHRLIQRVLQSTGLPGFSPWEAAQTVLDEEDFAAVVGWTHHRGGQDGGLRLHTLRAVLNASRLLWVAALDAAAGVRGVACGGPGLLATVAV